jgi:putative transposase
MSDAYQSLAHSKWDCKYHIVFVSKRRRKAIFGKIRREVGPVFHALAKQKEVPDRGRTPEGRSRAYVPRDSAEAPGGVGYRFLKRRSAIAIARLSGKERNFSGEHFWARGYAVSTVGFELEQARQYIREQDAADGSG